MATAKEITKAFKRIENELIHDMIKHLEKHKVDEVTEGKQWEMWQALQLKELEKYKHNNAQKFGTEYLGLNKKIQSLFLKTGNDAQLKEEHALMKAIKAGDYEPPAPVDTSIGVGFFGINEGKMNALLDATEADFVKAEHSIFRKANDEYRKIIFDAQMYASAGSYEKAIDMATKDFIKAGFNTIQYKGWYDKDGKYHQGAQHKVSDYAAMAIKTGQKRAHLMGEGNVHARFGNHTVQVNIRQDMCPVCAPWVGKVLVDDVYGGGTFEEAAALNLPTLSQAMAEGFLHPNCKDMYSLYIEGISLPAIPWTQEELDEINAKYNTEQKMEHAMDMVDTYQQLANNQLDPENKAMYEARADKWLDVHSDLLDQFIDEYDSEVGTENDTLEWIMAEKTPQEVYDEAKAAYDALDAEYYKALDDYMNAPPETEQALFDKWKEVKEKLDEAKEALAQASSALPKPEYVLQNGLINKTAKMKGSVNGTLTKPKAYHEMTLKPNVKGTAELIKSLETTSIAQDKNPLLKKLYQQGLDLIAQKQAELKAIGAPLKDYTQLGGLKASWTKKLNKLTLSDDITSIQDTIKLLEEQKEYELGMLSVPPDKVYSGIWKDDVKLSDWKDKAASFLAKEDYYNNKIAQGYDTAHYQQMLDLLHEYQKEGQAYYDVLGKYDPDIKQLQAELQQKQNELDILLHGKKAAASAGGAPNAAYDEARLKAVQLNTDARKSDREFRPQASAGWLAATDAERQAAYDYTAGSGKFNHVLYFKEPLATEKGYGRGWDKSIRKFTTMIDKSPALSEDHWVRRGTGYTEIAQLVGFGKDKGSISRIASDLHYKSESELKKELIGKGGRLYNFLSTSPTEGHGFSGDIDILIFAPTGSKGIYSEPFSHYGDGAGRRWDGKSEQRSIGYEQEYIFQRGGWYDIIDVKKTYRGVQVTYLHRPEKGYDTYDQ